MIDASPDFLIFAAQTSATISWALNEPATGQVEYGTTSSLGQTSAKESSLSYSAHVQSLSGLTPGSLYSYRVRSVNQAGGETVSASSTFTTSTATQQTPDAGAPYTACQYPPDVKYARPTVPAIAKPALLAPVAATEFGTQMVRITDNVQLGYSKKQPWNRDQTLILLNGGRIYDAKTHAYLRRISVTSEAVWSSTDPNKLFDHASKSGNQFYSVNATTGVRTTLHSFVGYSTLSLGPSEGNISRDDATIALIGDSRDIIVYDIANDSVVATKALSSLGYTFAQVDWVSVSQSGNYVVVQGPVADPVKSYDRNMNYVATVFPYGEHADLGIDSAGSDVYVAVGSAGRPAKMGRLSDGMITTLLSPGGQPGHMSTRNYLRPGWAYLTFEYSNMPVGALSYIIGIKLDGSQLIERFANHRTSGASYAAQAKGVVSPDGTMVMWNSDWNGSSTVDAYVACMPK